MKKYLFLLCVALTAFSCRQPSAVYDLTCEGLVEPLGIDTAQPHFSWKIRSGRPVEQQAYEIQVASTREALEAGEGLLWDSGKVASDRQVMVPWQGEELHSRQQAWWRVRVWCSDGKATPWSDAQRFGVGIIGEDKLQGDYIGSHPGEGRSPLLRKQFHCDRADASALLYVNSLGYHEAYLNGQKVSPAVLQPAVSQLDRRSLTVVYDVSELLCEGENELVIWAGSGWYKPTTFDAVYAGPLVKAELDIEGKPFLWTDASWEGSWSGYRDSGVWLAHRFGGEVIDARVAGVPSWQPVNVVAVDGIVASMQMCEPCVVQETLAPVDILPEGDGCWLVDFGRAMNGFFQIKLSGLPEGHVVKASYSDHRWDDGRLEVTGSDEYIASGAAEGDVFCNKFNHHVFRYVLLEGLPQAPQPSEVCAFRVRTDYKATASFTCSDEELNRIHDMVRYTLENLAFDGYMVDCANIERLGYGGDGNASTQTLQILFDTAPLYLNWLQAWADAMRPDGGLPHTAPCPQSAGGGPYWCSFIVQGPWRTYMNDGDGRLLERLYPFMQQWLRYVDAYTVDGLLERWPDTDYRSWYLGDWAAPEETVNVQDPESVELVNNCALCQSYLDLAAIATLLGKPDDAREFTRRYEALARCINEKLYHPDTHTYASGSQIDLAYPLLVGIVPDGEVRQVTECLKERTATVYQGHLYTGLVGIPVLAEWAVQAGEADFMYGMLKQHGYPGYLYMLDNGATGTWEHWDGDRSRLHNCFNGIGSWFYQALGGIVPDAPGYRHIQLNPQLPAGVEWVHVTQETPYGTIVVRRNGNRLHMELPVGIGATLRGREYTCGTYDIKL